jgi:hypothetical protein
MKISYNKQMKKLYNTIVVVFALIICQPAQAQAPVHTGSIVDGTVSGALLKLPSCVYVSGNYAYLTSNTSDALEIVDISDPVAPVHTASLTDGEGGALLKFPVSVYISGNYAYIASIGNSALEIVDISNPAMPVHKGSLTDGMGGALLNYPTGVFISGNYAYVASGASNALEIIDISNPAAPMHAGSISDGDGGAALSFPLCVYVVGDYAYVASGNSNALEVIDVSNPTAPVHKGKLVYGTDGKNMLFGPLAVYVSGNYAYVASGKSNALEIVDISNPTNPVHKAALVNNTLTGTLLDDPISVYVDGNYAYIASYNSNALEIVDISNPAVPLHKGSLTDGTHGALLQQPVYVFVVGKQVYIASRLSNALEIVTLKEYQTITGFVMPSTYTITGGGMISLTGTATSGLPLSFHVSGPASISGSSINIFSGGGSVTITATQLGNSEYYPANSATWIINVTDLKCFGSSLSTSFTSYLSHDTLYLQVYKEQGFINYHNWTVAGKNFQFTTVVQYPLSVSDQQQDSLLVTLSAIDIQGCTTTVERKISLAPITSFKNIYTRENFIKVYPNPAQGEINIECSSEGVFYLYDLQKRLLKKFKLDFQTQKLDIGELRNGIYVFQFISEGFTTHGKVVKDK